MLKRPVSAMFRFLRLEKLESRELLAVAYIGPTVIEGSGLSFPAEYVGIDSTVTKRAEVRLADRQGNILDSDRALVWSRGDVHGRLRFPPQPGVFEIYLLDEDTLAVLARDQVTIRRPGQLTESRPVAPPAAASPASSIAVPSKASTPSGPAPIMNSSGRVVTPGEVPVSGDMAQIAASLGLSQSQVVELRRQRFPGRVTSDEGKPGTLEDESIAERLALPVNGSPIGFSKSNFDNSRGERYHAPVGTMFANYANGAVRIVEESVDKLNESETAKSSLFGQTTEGGKPVEGFRKVTLGYEPIPGKSLQDVVQSVFNPKTGVEVFAGPGKSILIYTDNTYEIRRPGDPPGVAVPIDQLGPTAEELRIDRNTEIKGPNGEIARAPQSAAQARANAKTPEELDKVIQQEGLISTTKLEYVGTQYRDQKSGQLRIARDGFGFFQDPVSKGIIERPIELKLLAKPTTLPSALAGRNEAKKAPAAPAQKPRPVPAVSKKPASSVPANSNKQNTTTSAKSPSAAEQRRTLRNRLSVLEKLKRDTHRLFQKIFQELDDAVEEADKIRDGADNAASLALLTMTAANIVAVLRSGPRTLLEFDVELGKVATEEVAQYGLDRFNLLSPSFWSDMVELAINDGQTTQGLLAETREKVRYDYAQTMTVIDKKIAQVQQQLAAVK